MKSNHGTFCPWFSRIKVGLSALIVLFICFGCAPKAIRVPWYLSEKRTTIVRSALSLQGKAYKGGAKGPDAFDCSGFVHYVYKTSGIMIPVNTEALNKTGIEISKEEALPGDLVFFRNRSNLHVGIVLSNSEFIHASSSRGVVVDAFSMPYWTRSLYGFRSAL